MEYKVHELAKLSGVSSRTLRYYHEIGLLVPWRVDTNGYRMYDSEQVDRLQQILFYREMEVPLEQIKEILSDKDFDRQKALEQHLITLQNKKRQIELLISNVNATILSAKEDIFMSDKEKFEGFKQQLIDENESKYGKEVRKKFGNENADAFNQKIKGMSQEDWNKSEQLRLSINKMLHEAFKDGNPSSQIAQKVCDMHRQWICMLWKNGTYSKDAHMALVEGYMCDERFKEYYDKIAIGCTEFLRDAMKIYCKK